MRTHSLTQCACPGFLLVVLAVTTMLVESALAGDFGSRAMSGWFNVTSADGWSGRRYMDGDLIFAEEFDANNDGRIDVWRFYRRGVLSSEERDLNGDGKVDYQTRWDVSNGYLTAVLRDTHKRGTNDVELEYKGKKRWELREDRNLDGVTDSILIFNAPADFFDSLGSGLASQGEIASTIPREYWRELHVDEGFTGSITDYYRFSRGTLVNRGEWNGRRIVWSRPPADALAGRAAGRQAGRDPRPAPAPSAPTYPDTRAPYGESPAVTAVRDPFNLAAGSGVDVDPYAGLAGPRSMPSGSASGGGYVPPHQPGMPIGESSARSVPARMRPPGTSRSR